MPTALSATAPVLIVFVRLTPVNIGSGIIGTTEGAIVAKGLTFSVSRIGTVKRRFIGAAGRKTSAGLSECAFVTTAHPILVRWWRVLMSIPSSFLLRLGKGEISAGTRVIVRVWAVRLRGGPSRRGANPTRRHSVKPCDEGIVFLAAEAMHCDAAAVLAGLGNWRPTRSWRLLPRRPLAPWAVREMRRPAATAVGMPLGPWTSTMHAQFKGRLRRLGSGARVEAWSRLPALRPLSATLALVAAQFEGVKMRLGRRAAAPARAVRAALNFVRVAIKGEEATGMHLRCTLMIAGAGHVLGLGWGTPAAVACMTSSSTPKSSAIAARWAAGRRLVIQMCVMKDRGEEVKRLVVRRTPRHTSQPAAAVTARLAEEGDPTPAPSTGWRRRLLAAQWRVRSPRCSTNLRKLPPHVN